MRFSHSFRFGMLPTYVSILIEWDRGWSKRDKLEQVPKLAEAAGDVIELIEYVRTKPDSDARRRVLNSLYAADRVLIGFRCTDGKPDVLAKAFTDYLARQTVQHDLHAAREKLTEAWSDFDTVERDGEDVRLQDLSSLHRRIYDYCGNRAIVPLADLYRHAWRKRYAPACKKTIGVRFNELNERLDALKINKAFHVKRDNAVVETWPQIPTEKLPVR